MKKISGDGNNKPHLVGKSVDRYTKSSRKAEVTELELPFAVNKQILGFEIAMKDLIFMAKSGSFQELVHEAAYDFGLKGTAITVLIHVFFQILLAELKDENELRLTVDNVVEANDVGMFELLH